MAERTYYTTRGPVRGSCGHKHRSIRTALRCAVRDQHGCNTQGGYSDRSIRAIEGGEERMLTEIEDEYLEEAEYDLRDRR